jgi:hypothetical protein
MPEYDEDKFEEEEEDGCGDNSSSGEVQRALYLLLLGCLQRASQYLPFRSSNP